jgi:hypothetical protein
MGACTGPNSSRFHPEQPLPFGHAPTTRKSKFLWVGGVLEGRQNPQGAILALQIKKEAGAQPRPLVL